MGEAISDFTRRVCRSLCFDRAVELEIARLDRSIKAMRDHGHLTEVEAIRDREDRERAERFFDVAMKGGAEEREPPASGSPSEPAPEQVLAAFDALQGDLFLDTAPGTVVNSVRRSIKDRRDAVRAVSKRRL